MANWKETAHHSCRKGKLRNKCLPSKAPQWAIVTWCQIPYIISPGNEQKCIFFKMNYYPRLCRGRRSWKKQWCSHLPLSLHWNFLFLGEELKSASEEPLTGNVKPHRSLEICRDDGQGWVRLWSTCSQGWVFYKCLDISLKMKMQVLIITSEMVVRTGWKDSYALNWYGGTTNCGTRPAL